MTEYCDLQKVIPIVGYYYSENVDLKACGGPKLACALRL